MVDKMDFFPARKISYGDTIGLFSPSEPLANDRPERLEKSLQNWAGKFRTKFSKHAFAERYYEAGTAEQRIGDIRQLANDLEVSALFGTWGGKSCNQLVPSLPYDDLANSRKPVAGFSDVCVLLNAITYSTGLITFSGPNVAGKLQESTHFDLDLVRGLNVKPFGNELGWSTVTPGKAVGRLVGGNLSTFVLGLSGWFASRPKVPKIFFWESASEPPQLVDQHLYCLVNSGFFESVSAMVVGDVTYEEEARKDRPLHELLSEFGKRLGIPVVKVENFGHKKVENPIVPIGGLVNLDTDSMVIDLMEPVVSE